MLTLAMVQDILKDYRLEIHYVDGEKRYDSLREGNDEKQPSLLYACQEGTDTWIGAGTENVIARNADAHVLYVLIADRLDRLHAWERRLQKLVFSESSLQDIVDISAPVFRNAIMITDESNRICAMSRHGIGEVSPEWDYMVQNRSTELSLVLDIFRTEPFRSHALSGSAKPFYFVPPGLKTGGINCRIPSPDGRSCLGTALITTNLTPVSTGMMQVAEIFAEAVNHWATLHAQEMPMTSASAVFAETLDGVHLGEDRAMLLYTAVHSAEEVYRIFCVRGLPELMLESFVHAAETALPVGVCCKNEQQAMILLPEAQSAAYREKLKELMGNTGGCAGMSQAFNDLHILGAYALQAVIAASYGEERFSPLTGECMMRYAADQIKKTPLRESAAHPALQKLDEYDRRHGTEFCITLYVFLRHERSLAQALKELNIHRNTLIYRLKRLETLMDADLNDPSEREYLLLSYRILQLVPNVG